MTDLPDRTESQTQRELAVRVRKILTTAENRVASAATAAARNDLQNCRAHVELALQELNEAMGLLPL